MKTPITYWGGKQMMVNDILPLIPPHTAYCEPFFGGGAVFFQKPKSQVEIINDLNKTVINFYQQSKSNFAELQKLVRQTPHSRALYRDALVMYNYPHLFSNVERAWAFYVGTNQGYAGKIGTWGYGTVTPCCEKKAMNSREKFIEDLRERLEMTQIESQDALKVLELRDRPSTFFYLDPPYYNSNMGHYSGYLETDYEALLRQCEKLEGKFLLSSYPSEILAKFVEKNGWYQKTIDKVLSASPNRRRKVEVLTANYPI